MKTSILLSVFAILIATMSLSAGNVKTYTNHYSDDKQIVKEFTRIEQDSNQPLQKEIYTYATDGKMLSKETFKWSGRKGWEGILCTEYQYSENMKVDKLRFTKWDKVTNGWSENAEELSYYYSDKDELILVDHSQIAER